jgi:hypothetical protein
MATPTQPKLYHIVHMDRLPSILRDGFLFSDAQMVGRIGSGTTIGMGSIKLRRLNELQLESHPGLHVGECVPFYFCPRSVMLYIIHQANHAELTYRGGQQPIVHLEVDLRSSVTWAAFSGLRWAFTLSNAGSNYFEDRADLSALDEIDWKAVAADKWSGRGVSESVQEGKQAEFLVESRFPWQLIERVGVVSPVAAQRVANLMSGVAHRPRVEILPGWYY